MRIMTFALVGVLLFLVAMVVLQIFLSRRENKWAGRILPIITFGYSLVMMLNVAQRRRKELNKMNAQDLE